MDTITGVLFEHPGVIQATSAAPTISRQAAEAGLPRERRPEPPPTAFQEPIGDITDRTFMFYTVSY